MGSGQEGNQDGLQVIVFVMTAIRPRIQNLILSLPTFLSCWCKISIDVLGKFHVTMTMPWSSLA